MAPATRHEVIDYITVVGNLIGQATVDVVPRVGGRIESIPVKLGDRVSRGQLVAKIEDDQIREQINQRMASLKVNEANVTQRENDAKLAETVYARMKAQYDRDLLSKQLLEDAEAKYNTAVSNVGVAKAQLVQTQRRFGDANRPGVVAIGSRRDIGRQSFGKRERLKAGRRIVGGIVSDSVP